MWACQRSCHPVKTGVDLDDTIPYHPGHHGIDCHKQRWGQLSVGTLQLSVGTLLVPTRMGRKGGQCIYSRPDWCAATAILLVVMCSGGWGDTDGLCACCLMNYDCTLGFSEPCTTYTYTHLLFQCWLALEVWVPLNPVLVACHRFKRTQADALCLAKILISESLLITPREPISHRVQDLNTGSPHRQHHCSP